MKKNKEKSEESEDKSTENEDEPIEEVEYYKMAFKRLEKEGKHTWNWAAFFFGYVWALYRKMYLYAFLYIVLSYILDFIIKFGIDSQTSSIELVFIKLISSIFLGIIWGYYGNYLYYRTVKKRIAEGNHLLIRYRPTSFWGIFGGWFSYLFMPIGDYFAHRKFFETHKLKNNSVTAKTIEAYLYPAKENNWYSRGAIIISNLAMLFLVVGIFWLPIKAYSSADENTRTEMNKLAKEKKNYELMVLIKDQLLKGGGD